MLRNYLRVAFRYLRSHKGFSFLNVIGLTIGLSAFFLILLYVRFELSYDAYYSHSNRVYRIVSDVKTPEGIDHRRVPPLPTTIHIAKFLPEVASTTRVSPGSNVMLIRDNEVFDLDDAGIGDSSFFRVFDVPVIEGDPNKALGNPSSVVLSQSTAKWMFGSVDPIGKQLQLGRLKFPVKVTAVMKDMPENSHLKLSLILSLSEFEQMYPSFDSAWNNYMLSEYVLLKPGASAAALQASLPGYIKQMGGSALFKDGEAPTLLLEPVRDIYLYSTRDESKNGHIGNVYIFSIIGLFIVLIAAINFVNLTTARSMERAKEVGIRKVAGAGKWLLAGQFIGESIILCLIACVLALTLSTVMLPLFNQLAGKAVSEGVFTQPRYVGVLAGISVIIGFCAGFYPAMVMSAFRPVTMLKGIFRMSGQGILIRKGLVIVQFTIAIGLMIATLVVLFQSHYMRSQDLGFSKEQRLVMNTRNDRAKSAFMEALASIPGVARATMGSHVPGMLDPAETCLIGNAHGDMQVIRQVNYFVGYDYLGGMGMTIVAGRDFSPAFRTDGEHAMIVNETAVRQLGYTSPAQAIGKRFDQAGQTGTIIGVVKDFHLSSLQDPILALTMRLDPENCDLVCATIDGRHVPETLHAVEAKWKELLPDRPFTYFFLDEFFNRQYRGEEHFGRLFLCFAILAICISCLGLMGLAAYSTVRRTREIGLRKVVGASTGNIVFLLSRDFLRLVGWSFLIATPLSWVFVNNWLHGFAYRIGAYWWIFVLAGVAALAIALATVSYHAIRAAQVNPVKSLKAE